MTPERYYPENRFTWGSEPLDTYCNTVFEDADDARTLIDLLENHPDSFYPSVWHSPSNKDLNRLSSRIFNNVSIEALIDKEHGQCYVNDLWYFVSFTAYLADILADDDEESVIKNLEEIEFLNNTLIENKELHNRLDSILLHLRDYEMIQLAWWHKDRECDLYPIWDRVLSEFGYKKASAPKKHTKKPDGWVTGAESDTPIPVEIKLHQFNKAALKQLEDYMEIFGCATGIAIGEQLTCELPDNIRFISIKDLNDADAELKESL